MKEGKKSEKLPDFDGNEKSDRIDNEDPANIVKSQF